MSIIDLLSSPWAIVPDQLIELQSIYAAHFRGEQIDLAALEARLGRPLANDQKRYQMAEGTGVAVLEMAGVIAPKANLFTRVSGGATANLLQQQVNSMAADPKVKAVVIDMDSPGGNVLGVPALADAVRTLSAVKPTVAVSTGKMASAAYWIGSAANAVYLSGSTDMLGSIGVVATHTYQPPAAGSAVTTEITAGKYKRIASDTGPLTAEGQAYLQQQVDALYQVFVDAVASNRNASVDDVLHHMADGRIFIGQQAINAGLADGFGTVDQLVEQLATNPARFATRSRAQFAARPRPGKLPAATAAVPAPATHAAQPAATASATLQGDSMSPQEQAAAFAADHPEAATVLRQEGASAELTRIRGVRAQALPGHQALVDQLAFDGITTPADAAMAINAAERGKLAAQAASRLADAPKPVAQAAAEADPAPAASNLGQAGRLSPNTDTAALDAAAKQYQAQHPGTDYITALKAVQATQGA